MSEYFEAKIWMKSKQGENDYSMFINEQPYGGFKWDFLDYDPESEDYSSLYIHNFSIKDVKNDIEKLKEENARLREALEYYENDGGRDVEDIEIIVKQFSGHLIDVEVGGKRARKALGRGE